MNWRKMTTGRAIGAAVLAAALPSMTAGSVDAAAGFNPLPATFDGTSARITNRYLPISKFQHCVLKGADHGHKLRIVRDLQDGTKAFNYRGRTVQAAVVRDQTIDVTQGQRIEKTRDYFAQDTAGNVYYLGEDVSTYKDGKLTGHEGQWLLGRDTKRPGILMPARPKVGQRYQSEAVPGVAEEADTIVKSGRTVRVGGHVYHHVLRVRENASPPPEVEFKQYAPGVGVVTEGNGAERLAGCS